MFRPSSFFEDALGHGSLGATDIAESDSKLVLKFDLPGVSADDIDVSMTSDRAVHIKAERECAMTLENQEALRVLQRGRTCGSVDMRLSLPRSVDVDSMQADLDNGVLTIQANKLDQKYGHSVKVNTRQ